MASGTQGRNKGQPEDYNLALREKQVVELRLQGLEFEAIAEQTGYANHSGAWKAWKRALARIPIAETQSARLVEDMRLNVALEAIWDKVKDGDLWAIDRLVALAKERRALWGLDKPPQKAEPTQPQPLDIHVNFNPGDI
jgi:hypothetical protein